METFRDPYPDLRAMRAIRLSPLALFLCGAPLFAGDIEWKTSLGDSLREAGASQRVVFLAVNMDGERANDRMVKEVYKDKAIQALAERTINLVASNDTHAADGKRCPRFDGLTCKEHRQVDADARAEVLAPDARGYVVAPQHVFLDPKGEVILSVPYEVKVHELEWCFVAALKAVDPDLDLEASEDALPPKRLVMGDVYSLGEASQAAPLTREAALELISQLKKGLVRGRELRESRRKLAMADEREAREYLLNVLRTVPGAGGGGRGGGGAGGGGGGGGGRGNNAGRNPNDTRPQLMHWIGANSPVSYWEVAAEFIGENDLALRSEAVLALEQLGAKEAVRPLLKRLRKEEEESVHKNILRALGTCGADDKAARKALLKQAKSDKHPLLQINATVALGWLASDEDVDEFLAEVFLEGEETSLRTAAVLAMAVTRNEAWVEPLKAALEEGELEPQLEPVIITALSVIEGGPLKSIEGLVTRFCADELVRERIFGGGRTRGDDDGGGGRGRGRGRGGRGGDEPGQDE